ncbi:MAG: hypothetical protein DMG32_12875 [Acidobacteria bacterium]|nr:MAG: hypothetical protein DMG32_12875 [Acidobacteriota bacterium]
MGYLVVGALIYAGLILPLPLLAVAWISSNRRPIELLVLTLSALLFLSGAVRSLKLILLGLDYSHRLFTTIGVNILVATVLGLYFAIRRRWIAAIAAAILAVAWLMAGAINSAV